MHIPYTFHKNLVLRSPRFSFVDNMPENIIEILLEDKVFMEAIYLASPVLYDECERMKQGKIKTAKDLRKIENSLIKYYQRMYSRCTPFGMFAGCAVTQWHDGPTNIIYNENIHRNTRLDMHFLCAFAQQLATRAIIKHRILYFPNSSIYTIADEVRYIEYKYVNGKREHQITSVAHSPYLVLILEHAKPGITIEKMLQLLMDNESVTEEEAMTFVDEMIDGQLLVNELEPAITGKEFIYQLIEVLQRINSDENAEITGIVSLLQHIQEDIQSIDNAGNNAVHAYKILVEKIKKIGIPFEENKLFQVDFFRSPAIGQVSLEIQQSLLKSFLFLNGLNSNNKNENLTAFVKKFTERYEGKQMPLLQLLDVENGIGYGNNAGKNISPLLENLALPGHVNPGEHTIQWNTTQEWLFKKLMLAAKNNLYEVKIEGDDIKRFVPRWDDLPPSVSVMFNLQGDKIVLENISGSSAANLLGRFAHGNKAIDSIVNEIVGKEQELNSDVIVAEIVHLPQSRTGNILLHPAFIKYEIPFLAKSSLPLQQQINAGDLYVSVSNGYIKLFSKNLQKEIVPRLSTAHNFSYQSLPLYHFLCDLQSQQLRNSFSFNWGSTGRYCSFLPRVILDNVILFEATWKLSKNDCKIIVDDVVSAMPAFILQWKFPRYVVLADGDNELLVDFENQLSVLAFIDAIKNRDTITVKEYITDKAIKDAKGNFFNNQFIAPLIKTEKVYGIKQPASLNSETSVLQNFSPGSEWVYYKLYCGIKSADKLLLDYIEPVAMQFLHENKIDKWFFIRYNDPDFHIRIRFHATDEKHIGSIIQVFSLMVKTAVESGLVWKMQMDTYMRELERYTPEAIHLAETIFYKDSMQILYFLKNTQGDERENARWLYGIQSIDHLLNAFNYSLAQKHLLIKNIKDAFAKEFKADKNLFQQLNKKYTLYKSDIKNAIDNDLLMPFDILNKDAEDIFDKIIYLVNPEKLNDVLASFIHMSLNRLFPSDARVQEMIVYDFMFKYYHSEMIQKNIPVATQTAQ